MRKLASSLQRAAALLFEAVTDSIRAASGILRQVLTRIADHPTGRNEALPLGCQLCDTAVFT